MPAWSYGSVNGQAVPLEELSNLLFFWVALFLYSCPALIIEHMFHADRLLRQIQILWSLVRITHVMVMSASKLSIAASLLHNSSKSRHLQPRPLLKCAHYLDLAIHLVLAHFDLVLNANRLLQRKHD